MAEETQELNNSYDKFEDSRNKTEVLRRALEGAQKVGAALMRATEDIMRMIFKR